MAKKKAAPAQKKKATPKPKQGQKPKPKPKGDTKPKKKKESSRAGEGKAYGSALTGLGKEKPKRRRAS